MYFLVYHQILTISEVITQKPKPKTTLHLTFESLVNRDSIVSIQAVQVISGTATSALFQPIFYSLFLISKVIIFFTTYKHSLSLFQSGGTVFYDVFNSEVKNTANKWINIFHFFFLDGIFFKMEKGRFYGYFWNYTNIWRKAKILKVIRIPSDLCHMKYAPFQDMKKIQIYLFRLLSDQLMIWLIEQLNPSSPLDLNHHGGVELDRVKVCPL